jgi:uncharacterized membrane protein
MEKAILLALAASFCTATASVCQRLGAKSNEVTGFDVRLIFRLARRPVWLLGLASMILGFVFQINALRFGPLALVQPILALELLFVFAYMAAIGRRVKVKRRDWLAAVAMSAGIGLFLRLASPSGDGCTRRAPGGGWPAWSPSRSCSSPWSWPSGRVTVPARPGPARRRCSGRPPGSRGVSWLR